MMTNGTVEPRLKRQVCDPTRSFAQIPLTPIVVIAASSRTSVLNSFRPIVAIKHRRSAIQIAFMGDITSGLGKDCVIAPRLRIQVAWRARIRWSAYSLSPEGEGWGGERTFEISDCGVCNWLSTSDFGLPGFWQKRTPPSPLTGALPFLQWQGLPKSLFFVNEFSQSPFPPICPLIHSPDCANLHAQPAKPSTATKHSLWKVKGIESSNTALSSTLEIRASCRADGLAGWA